MPLPLFLGFGAAAAAAAGVGTGVQGVKKLKDANITMKYTNRRHEGVIEYFERTQESTTAVMDELGKNELEILNSFEVFSSVFEKIQNKPSFETYDKDDVAIPAYDPEELKQVSIGAGVLLGGLGGAAAGTAGGFAAAGATYAAVMALGTASTGTAIASLSGVAATNATLAAIGGGAIAAGGGGMALGTTMLGVSTLGVGLLVGGVIFSVVGSTLSGKADEAYDQMKKTEREVYEICCYLDELRDLATRYNATLEMTNKIYKPFLEKLKKIVETDGKTDWNDFTQEERLTTQNTVLLVGLLYKMSKVQLVFSSEKEDEINTINKEESENAIANTEKLLSENGLAAFAD